MKSILRNIVTPAYLTIGSSKGENTGIPKVICNLCYEIWLFKKYDLEGNAVGSLRGDLLTISNKDFVGALVPSASVSTFAIPNTEVYRNIDENNYWIGSDLSTIQKSVADLILCQDINIYVKYADFDPYNVYAIGLKKADVILTDADRIALTKFFKLPFDYFGYLIGEGYMKDNRTLS